MATDLPTKPCRYCGKQIVWAKQADGKWIPLDPTPPIYQVVLRHDGEPWCERAADSMVTHFATCPKASQASSDSKKKKQNRKKWQDGSGG